MTVLDQSLCRSLIRCSRCGLEQTFAFVKERRKHLEVVCHGCLRADEHEELERQEATHAR